MELNGRRSLRGLIEKLPQNLTNNLVLSLAALILALGLGCSGHHTADTPPDQSRPPEQNVPAVVKGSGGHNAPEHLKKPIVLMISIDGFRHDYIEKYAPKHLSAIAQEGLRAESMISSFPSLTFPNHVTLVTGAVPGRHGIVGNSFYDKKIKKNYSIGDIFSIRDPSWYQSDALWTIAERNKMVSAVFFWVASESHIGGIDPTYFKPYDGTVPNGARVDQVIQWLKLPEEMRPHFMGLYFSDVDTVGHQFGTQAPELKKAIDEIDDQIGRLDAFIQQSGLPVNVLIMSDHGMQNLDKSKIIFLSDIVDITKFEMPEKGAVMNLYSDDQKAVDKAYKQLKAAQSHFHVYRRETLPKKFGIAHPTRTGDLVVVADMPYYLVDKHPKDGIVKMSVATHGWDPNNPNMHAFFIAKGPNIKPHSHVPSFSNVHVFPMVMEILGLEDAAKRDGDISVLGPYLK